MSKKNHKIKNPKLASMEGVFGEDHPGSTLTNAKVIAIKQFFATGLYTRKLIAEMFKVNIKVVHNILAEYNWKNIRPEDKDLKGLPNLLGMKPRAKVTIGEVFGNYTVIGTAPNMGTHRCVQCRCSCGNEKSVRITRLTLGKSTRCIKCAAKIASNKAKEKGVYKNKHGICTAKRVE